MNPWIGWTLAGVALWAGWQGYGWPGIALAFSAIVFWLLLQFSRSVRVMRNASESPVGHVDSAVMLNAKLQPGMTMLQVVGLTGSLGRRLGDGPEQDDWAWSDEGGSTVRLHFTRGKLARFELDRPAP